ncbi:hypothetical protein FQZ97_750790 [compost metagenome]
MVRREQRAHGDRLVDAAVGLAAEVGVERLVFGGLGGFADAAHFLHGLERVAARGGFGGEHHGVGAVEHGVGHVAHLGARGHGVGDHRLHHLGRGDDHLVHVARHADHLFLQRRHGGVAHFHGEVATGDHDAVAGAQDFFQLRNGFGALDLGDHAGLVAVLGGRHVAQLARHFHVGGVLGEAHGHVVGLEAHRGLDVFHVLGRQRGRREAAALLVDALVVRQLAAELDGGVHRFALDAVDREHDQAVVQQQLVAGLHVARQVLVVQADGVDVAQLGARGIEHELGAGFEPDLALRELADADLRTLQVGHDGHFAAGLAGGFAHHGGAVDVVLRRAVAEVQPHHADLGQDHLFQQFRRAGGGAEGGDDLGGVAGDAVRAHEGVSVLYSLLYTLCVSNGSQSPRGISLPWPDRRRNQPAARLARISKAGRVLPSSTSRKAPPPVEM